MELTTPRGYSAADTADLHQALARLRSRYPRASIVAAGFSLGGNLLTKYLGEYGRNTPLAAGVSVSNPFTLSVDEGVHAPGIDLTGTAHTLRYFNRQISRLYFIDT